MENLLYIYNKISKQFNTNRVRIWQPVKNFLDNLNKNSKILDIGCGNGKNMFYRSDLNFYGIDFCVNFINFVKLKGGKVKYGLLQNIPYGDNTFDHFICIASYHHLDNDNDRKKSIKEMYRILKKNGTGVISVWAMEQEKNSPFHFKNENEMVPWISRDDGKTYYRYYHIYSKNKLKLEIQKFEPRFNIIDVIYNKGNWYNIVQK